MTSEEPATDVEQPAKDRVPYAKVAGTTRVFDEWVGDDDLDDSETPSASVVHWSAASKQYDKHRCRQ